MKTTTVKPEKGFWYSFDGVTAIWAEPGVWCEMPVQWVAGLLAEGWIQAASRKPEKEPKAPTVPPATPAKPATPPKPTATPNGPAAPPAAAPAPQNKPSATPKAKPAKKNLKVKVNDN